MLSSPREESPVLRRFRLAVPLLLLPGALTAQPILTIEANAVVASGVTAGGQVAFLGVGREPVEWSGRVVRFEAVLADDDGDGTVRFILETVVPWRSVWAAVDLATGGAALAAPAGYPLRTVALPADALAGAGGDSGEVVLRGDLVEILVVRPGLAGAETGAWGLTAWDGHEGDQDGVGTGSVALRLPGLEPVGTTRAAPERLVPGDVLIAIDPNRLEASLTRLAAQ
jgi:hypothetical protein